MSSSSRQQLEKWIKNKSVMGKVLDVGGSQLPVKGRIAYDEKTTFTILDLSTPHEEKQKPDIILDLNLPLVICREVFDTVICLEVTEYLWNPVQAIQNMANFLKPGGRLLISFHYIYPVHSPEGKDFLRYTDYGARMILSQCGFEIMECTDRIATESPDEDLLKKFYVREGMRPLKGYDTKKIGCLIEAKKI